MSNAQVIDLFNYPKAAGFKRTQTSAQAAEDITPKAPAIREMVLAVLHLRDMTADEMAYHLSMDKLSVRPRFSELRAMGKIRDTGERRANGSGKKAIVWGVDKPLETA
jgi:hypothetical protein